MTTIYYQSRLIALLVLILSIAGCQAESDNMLTASEDYMTFSVDLSDLSLDTRVKSRSDENDELDVEWVNLTGEEKKEFQISSLNTVVVFFDEDGKYILHTSKGISTTNLLFSSRSFYFSLSLAQFERLQSIGKVKMTVVANFEESLLETIFGSFWENLETYEDLETKVVSTRFNDLGYPGALLMDGSTYVDFSPLKFTDKRTNLNARLRLKRAASKIRLLVNYQPLYSKGGPLRYRVSEIKAKLTYYQKETALVGGFNGKARITPNISVSDWLDLDHVVSKFPGYDAETADDEEFLTTKYPMFSYEIPSRVDVGLRPFILLRLKIDDMKELKSAYYLYKVPFSVSILSKFILERNKYYFIRANIGDLGALDTSQPEEPIEVPAVIVPEISVLDNWSENIVVEKSEIEIQSDSKLKLPEREITLYDELSYDIPYESDTKIEAKIERVEYYKYSLRAAPEYVSVTSLASTILLGDIASITDNKIKFKASGYLPKHTPITYHIKVSCKVNGQDKTVEQWVKLVYYPAYTLRVKKSKGFYVNETDDFRFHDALGIYNLSSSAYEPNNNLIRITANLQSNSPDEKVAYIGDPTDVNGRTKMDSKSNQLISPDFIISSDRATTPALKQDEPITDNGSIGYWERVEANSSGGDLFAPTYGPLERYGVTSGAYYRGQTYTNDGKTYKTNQTVYRYGGSARDRCFNYFEDDYGPHTRIEEQFLHSNGGQPMLKHVDIKPKYEGRWRMPTTAELMLIRKFYNEFQGTLQNFLPYYYYWSAEKNTIVPFVSFNNDHIDVARVFCVFDVWKLKNHNEKDYEK